MKEKELSSCFIAYTLETDLELQYVLSTCVFLSKRMDSKTLQGEIISMWEQRTVLLTPRNCF